ncbi:MAG: oxidoreductase [Elusimicrobia bacterium]|nr:oxidoreductase [Elusimicrobiota bacterium]
MNAATAAWLGHGAGVAALAAMLAAGALAARVPGGDLRLGGLARIWKVHHLLGAFSFLLVMAHPLLLAQASGAAYATLFPPLEARAVWAGWLAWAAMTAFLAPTFHFFGKPDYRRWKSLHALSGIAALLALAHAVPLSRATAARALWLAGGAAAMAALAYRKFVAPSRRLRYAVREVRLGGRGVVELTLKPEGEALKYRSGQFLYLTPPDGEEHPFSISSAPDEENLRLMIKDLGDATHALQTIEKGTAVAVEGPYGAFLPGGETGRAELWIAGGVGLAPFLGAARALQGRSDVVLIYCVQDRTRAHFIAELETIAQAKGMRLKLHEFARAGALTRAYLREACPDAAGREVFVCGPPPLIDAARKALKALGARRIQAEDFTWL